METASKRFTPIILHDPEASSGGWTLRLQHRDVADHKPVVWGGTEDECNAIAQGVYNVLDAIDTLDRLAVTRETTANREGPTGRDHPATSRRAAKLNMPRSGTQRATVLVALFNGGGMTDEQIARVTGLGHNSVRPRRIELVELGLVRPTVAVRTTRAGAAATVWATTELGEKVARDL